MAKRERSVNFSYMERELLVSLIQKHKNVLENKQSDASTWRQKEAAWKTIEREFNARSGAALRTAKTLKIKHEGMKRTVRKKSAEIRSQVYLTGGGKNTAPPLDTVEENIKEMVTLSADGMNSNCDSDLLQTQQTQEVEVDVSEYIVKQSEPDVLPSTRNNRMDSYVEENEDTDTLHDTPSATPAIKKWDLTSRKNLKTKKHPALMATLPKKNKIDDLTDNKLELVRFQKKLLEEEQIEKKKEWEFKELQRSKELEFMQRDEKRKEEEHKWKMEEHQLRMEI